VCRERRVREPGFTLIFNLILIIFCQAVAVETPEIPTPAASEELPTPSKVTPSP